MKKIYVKPMASNVAFVVNENIAASDIDFKEVVGRANYIQNGDDCNKYFAGTGDILIETHLAPGDFNPNTAMANLTLEEQQLILDLMLAGKIQFIYG